MIALLLAGIIKTNVRGQSSSIIRDVNVLIDRYMQQPHSIILAVVPSNQDVATVEVLERAARFDAQGDRTIGVLTKPDLIDQGAEHEAVSVLRNLTKPLQLGYIMVKDRSQHDIARGKQTLFLYVNCLQHKSHECADRQCKTVLVRIYLFKPPSTLSSSSSSLKCSSSSSSRSSSSNSSNSMVAWLLNAMPQAASCCFRIATAVTIADHYDMRFTTAYRHYIRGSSSS
jgi:Dynamin family